MDTLLEKAREFIAGKEWSVTLIVELHKFLLKGSVNDEHSVILTILRTIRDAEVLESESTEKVLTKLPWNDYKKIVVEICPAIHAAFADPMKELNILLGEVEDIFEMPRPSSASASGPAAEVPVLSCLGRLFSLLFPSKVKSASPVVPVDNTREGLEIRSALPALPGSVDSPVSSPPDLSGSPGLSCSPDLSGVSLKP